MKSLPKDRFNSRRFRNGRSRFRTEFVNSETLHGVKHLKINQLEAEDEEVIRYVMYLFRARHTYPVFNLSTEEMCETVISNIEMFSGSLTTVVLFLNSEIHETFCTKTTLFRALASCTYLKELTLMLSQMKEDALNRGLIVLGMKVPLRKLCLVNSIASERSLELIGQEMSFLESVGFINCWYVSDEGISGLLEGCQNLSTLNVSYCKLVTVRSLLMMIEMCTDVKKPFKFYTKYSGVVYSDFNTIRCIYAGKTISFKDYLRLNEASDESENEAYVLEYLKQKRRKVTPKTFDLDAVPEDWEYDSDADFENEVAENKD